MSVSELIQTLSQYPADAQLSLQGDQDGSGFLTVVDPAAGGGIVVLSSSDHVAAGDPW